MDQKTLENIFTYHPPAHNQIPIYEELRAIAAMLARKINRECPESREKSTAITKVQEAVMWANAAIAIHWHARPDIPNHPPPLEHETKEEQISQEIKDVIKNDS
jgi:hypothetical protein